jgi:heme exporter protein A
VGVLRLKKQALGSLSAGQQRRVALARMLLADAPLWLLDEPFTNLDREGRTLVIQLVHEHVQAGGLCMLAAHQDMPIDVPTQRVRLQ